MTHAIHYLYLYQFYFYYFFYKIGYFLLIVLSGFFSILFIYQYIQRKTFKSAALALFISTFFIYFSWPFIFGRILYEFRCANMAGFDLPAPVDARQTGYLISGVNQLSEDRAIQLAIKDLASQRIAFFEVENSNPDFPYLRVYLEHKHSQFCVDYHQIEYAIKHTNIPAGTCIASKETDVVKSEYALHGLHMNNGDVEIVKRGWIDNTIASFRMVKFEHIDWRGYHRTLTCPKCLVHGYDPRDAITAMTFMDIDGNIVSQASLAQYMAANRDAARSNKPSLSPPNHTGEADDAAKNLDCSSVHIDPDAHVVEISIYAGKPIGGYKVDKSKHTVGYKNVIVNQPDKLTFLKLKAYDPTIWRIFRTKDSKIAGVIATGYHGQVVLGVNKTVPVLINSYYYNPGINCSSAQLSRVLSDKVFRQSRQVPADSHTVYVGEPAENSQSLLYSEYRKISDYQIDD